MLPGCRLACAHTTSEVRAGRRTGARRAAAGAGKANQIKEIGQLQTDADVPDKARTLSLPVFGFAAGLQLQAREVENADNTGCGHAVKDFGSGMVGNGENSNRNIPVGQMFSQLIDVLGNPFPCVSPRSIPDVINQVPW